MRIDSSISQSQILSNPPAVKAKEVAGEREPDMDADDMNAKVAAAPSSPASQINPQGVGTKVDVLA